MSIYRSLNHQKFRISYHIIFSTKYRRKCLLPIANDIKSYMLESSKNQNWKISYIEIDKLKPDHIHFLIEATPLCQISEVVKRLKQYSTFYTWKNFTSYMKKFYWSGKHYLWTRGYFCSSLGEVSSDRVSEYIKNQG